MAFMFLTLISLILGPFYLCKDLRGGPAVHVWQGKLGSLAEGRINTSLQLSESAKVVFQGL